MLKQISSVVPSLKSKDLPALPAPPWLGRRSRCARARETLSPAMWDWPPGGAVKSWPLLRTPEAWIETWGRAQTLAHARCVPAPPTWRRWSTLWRTLGLSCGTLPCRYGSFSPEEWDLGWQPLRKRTGSGGRVLARASVSWAGFPAGHREEHLHHPGGGQRDSGQGHAPAARRPALRAAVQTALPGVRAAG